MRPRQTSAWLHVCFQMGSCSRVLLAAALFLASASNVASSQPLETPAHRKPRVVITSTRLAIPTDANAGQTIHVVAEATDDGTPALTPYERFVVTVR